ncbi:sn-glycerol-3-phosphate ABC transporter ATP-binding protein UgpC [Fertoebacter nigrum]|uniref:sn-glycerol-3-phosphate ABC transporter ATP-binding protein UgpC n=1 Tax=Fertoeibacter niger TaxID=2656921 RepID=A0A8X8H450_9RHOB|nr:sn-glycerol-3-phosphate ABC transporter ATP-binding protein UgpC [Fertoeibacter niger]NUB45248.1 sn-glycerol-3-phosphate ABC transporter ATP-binding protein UgpC [Fertoeibacter niger]
MADLKLTGLTKSFGAVQVIKGIDLDVQDRDFVVFVGPSGCGKSTLLRMIAGLEEITAGELTIDGTRANEVDPSSRGLAMVFQSYALYPHMTVAENMGFALRIAGVPPAERDQRVRAAADVLQLTPLLDRRPKALSGGQRQRVAIGRAIVRQPKVFLFDEPLSNLDAALRVNMRLELMRLHRELNATMIYVTHDQIEAMTMATRIVVMNAGRIAQVGPPLELYHHPANIFVAGFIGSPRMNFLPVTVQGSDAAGTALALPGGGALVLPRRLVARAGQALTLGIRPEHLRLTGGPAMFTGRVQVAEHLGGLTLLHVPQPGAEALVVQMDGAQVIGAGADVALTADPGQCHLFGADGAALA